MGSEGGISLERGKVNTLEFHASNLFDKSREGKLELNPNEMAFRKIYRHLIEEEKITAVFRPGKRSCGDFRGYCPGQQVTIRIIDEVGADWASLKPKFIKNFSKRIVVEEVTVKTIGELIEDDFIGTSPDVFDRESLRYHLGVIYNGDPEDLSDEALITKTTFSYVTEEKSHNGN